jgi:hypothetical protein
MKTRPLPRTARFGLPFTLALAVAFASTEPGTALDKCGPTQRHGFGGCQTCPSIITSASLSAAELSLIFSIAGVQNAKYTVSNNVGTFDTGGANLPLRTPQPSPVSVQPVSGSIILVSYTAFPHIRDLSLTWAPWFAGDSNVTVNAQLSGHIDVHISTFNVNPTLTLTNLPVTITFGADPSGTAPISIAQVVVAPVGAHASVDGCGAFDWCDGLVRDRIENAVQGPLQQHIADHFNAALNAPAFWSGVMSTLANSDKLPTQLRLLDPAGFPLPRANEQTPGGTTTFWRLLPNDFSYRGGVITARFTSSDGLCYIDCRPKRTQDQVCGASGGCGESDDGCGDTITCPGTCNGTNLICRNNRCEVCIPKTCASLPPICGFQSDGCASSVECQKCEPGRTCRNGACAGFGGPDGLFCKQCRADGGKCTPGPEGTNDCIFQ